MKGRRSSLLVTGIAVAIAFLATYIFGDRPVSPSHPQLDQRVGTSEVIPAGEPRVDHLARLIPEAAERNAVLDVIGRIERGEQLPYRQDGSVFQNREGRLPRHERRYYREYTVPTPGSRTRGARRVVTGDAGEIYYTRDHYRSFIRLDETLRRAGSR